jgi:hypothetical protein
MAAGRDIDGVTASHKCPNRQLRRLAESHHDT